MATQDVEKNDKTDKEGGVATLTKESVRVAPNTPARRPKELPPFRVLLHNDDVNTFEYVIQSIISLTTLSTQDALLRTLEAHEAGVALLLVTHQERAELFVEQFASLQLTVTAEPA